jgi:glycosyltransferase involved in cell wall biosynthesis
MKIGFISAGAGEMLCGSCIRDNALANALIQMKHDVLFCPLYTTICTDEECVKPSKQFYSGVNIYLQQRYPIFRSAPWILNSLLDGETLTKLVSKFGTDDKKLLSEMTKSMLLGGRGYQSRELKKLINWFKGKEVEVFNLPNTLLSGLAEEMKRELKSPVLSTLQGEDLFVEGFGNEDGEEMNRLMRGNVSEIDGFISVSRFYADFMHDYLGIPLRKIKVVYNGINLKGYDIAVEKKDDSFVVGYMARICKAKGLHILIDALKILSDDGLDVKVRAAGWLSKEDEGYLKDIGAKLKSWGIASKFEYLGVVDRRSKIEHLKTSDVLSVPTEYREPFGLYVLESLASGTPVVLPNHGAFPELIEETGGGLPHKPFDPEDLAAKITYLMENPDERKNLAEVGRKNVIERFNSKTMAENILNVYNEYNYRV